MKRVNRHFDSPVTMSDVMDTSILEKCETPEIGCDHVGPHCHGVR